MQRKVLLIEDDPFLVRFCKERLVERGYKAICIEDGSLAKKIAAYEQPDIIILDILLPGKDGFEILEDLKSDPITKNISVIVLSQLTDDSDKKRLIDLGCTTFMVKMDYQLSEVIDEVERIVLKDSSSK